MIIDSKKFEEIASRGVSQKTWDSWDNITREKYLKENPNSRYAVPNKTLPTQIKPVEQPIIKENPVIVETPMTRLKAVTKSSKPSKPAKPAKLEDKYMDKEVIKDCLLKMNSFDSIMNNFDKSFLDATLDTCACDFLNIKADNYNWKDELDSYKKRLLDSYLHRDFGAYYYTIDEENGQQNILSWGTKDNDRTFTTLEGRQYKYMSDECLDNLTDEDLEGFKKEIKDYIKHFNKYCFLKDELEKNPDNFDFFIPTVLHSYMYDKQCKMERDREREINRIKKEKEQQRIAIKKALQDAKKNNTDISKEHKDYLARLKDELDNFRVTDELKTAYIEDKGERYINKYGIPSREKLFCWNKGISDEYIDFIKEHNKYAMDKFKLGKFFNKDENDKTWEFFDTYYRKEVKDYIKRSEDLYRNLYRKNLTDDEKTKLYNEYQYKSNNPFWKRTLDEVIHSTNYNDTFTKLNLKKYVIPELIDVFDDKYKWKEDIKEDLQKIEDDSVNENYKDLVSRILDYINSPIIDIDIRPLGNGKFNGYVKTEQKTYNISTIQAGGYNIQRLHNRVIIE